MIMLKFLKTRDIYTVANRGLLLMEGLTLVLTLFGILSHLFWGKSLDLVSPLGLFKPGSSLVMIGLILNLLVAVLVAIGLIKNMRAPIKRNLANYLPYNLAMVWAVLGLIVDLILGLNYQASLYLGQILVFLLASLAAQEYNSREKRMRRHNYIRGLILR